VSDETPERSEMIRSIIITVLLTVVFFVIGLAFWAWSSPEVIETSPVGALNELNPALTILIEVLVMLMAFIFLSVTVINLRLMLTNIRAGWTEVIVVLIVMTIVASAMFGLFVGAATVVLSLGFVVYLYLLQD
jgi:O-antigen/teichoic acid export membrane protein